MPDKTVTRPCPRCRAPAAITWNQTFAYGADYPGREDVTGFDCPSGCELPFQEVQRTYPTARTQPPRSPAEDSDSSSPKPATAAVLTSDNETCAQPVSAPGLGRGSTVTWNSVVAAAGHTPGVGPTRERGRTDP